MNERRFILNAKHFFIFIISFFSIWSYNIIIGKINFILVFKSLEGNKSSSWLITKEVNTHLKHKMGIVDFFNINPVATILPLP